MRKPRRGVIMVAVQALDRSARPLLRKTRLLAKARDCDVKLVHVIALPFTPAVSRRAQLQQAARDIISDRRGRLQRLAASAELRGVQVSASVTWDYPAADGLVRQVLRHRPVMLLAESHRHSRLLRPFLSNTDWDLVRKCPCPVWLSKSSRAQVDGPVVAALDPLHAHAKPAQLDSIILEHALAVARGKPGRVLACHAYRLPAPMAVDGAVDAYWIGVSAAEMQQYEATVQRQLQRLTDKYHIPAANRLLVRGDAAAALARVAKQRRAIAVVMGAVSRSAMKRLFIGHTAERVLDTLVCDVLVVKPRGFRSDVALRPSLVPALPPI
ncbi:MAG TPA: universal stress protein [Steroidobacteraceae bacterium]|nr:universal stress protein [Steroidobacteraceae bacterium]